MSIANELSSDVAAELLKRGEGNGKSDGVALAEVALELHDTLQDLKAESDRQRRRRSRLPAGPPSASVETSESR